MRLKELYKKEILAKLKTEFGYTNALEAPRVEKVVLNVGLGKNFADKVQLENVISTLEKISGQKPVPTVAKK